MLTFLPGTSYINDYVSSNRLREFMDKKLNDYSYLNPPSMSKDKPSNDMWQKYVDSINGLSSKEVNYVDCNWLSMIELPLNPKNLCMNNVYHILPNMDVLLLNSTGQLATSPLTLTPMLST